MLPQSEHAVKVKEKGNKLFKDGYLEEYVDSFFFTKQNC